MSTTLEQIDLAAKAFWAQHPTDRDAAFAVLRRENPVPWSRAPESDLLPPELNTEGFWSLTKYEDIRYASRNPKIFSSAEGITMETFDPMMTEAAQSFIAMDAPRHTQLRGITLDAFKPKNMRRLEDWIRGHARDLVQEMAPKGEGDFVDMVSMHLPGRIFASFFGIPDHLYDKTISAAQRLLAWSDPEACGDQTGLEMFADCVIDLHSVAQELSEERRDNPGEDLFSWMLAAEWEGQKMTEDEICAFFVLLAVAANDTTRHSSAHAIRLFSENPDQLALLQEDMDGRIDGAIEEILRVASPLVHMRRTATEDVQIRDAQIKKGDKVVLWYCSGNRDEEVYEDPDRFDILRDPNRHVAFGGGGPHYCLGNALGRTTLKSLIREVYGTMPDIKAEEPDYQANNFINGIHRLQVRWTPPAAGTTAAAGTDETATCPVPHGDAAGGACPAPSN
ncbi:MAG: cytochrome P450 [Solirubrobacteraceae bacterium]|nr:cytochrome P450 [Solirubrobacteraceae bacterium]